MPTDQKLTRGERNNNPGNIRESAGDTTRWSGERDTDDDAAFEEFKTPHDGIRALAKVLLNYQRKHHLQTLREIIARWAPASENNTDSYVRAVAADMNVPPVLPIDLEDAQTLAALTKAIIHHENGRCIYTTSQIRAAVEAAMA